MSKVTKSKNFVTVGHRDFMSVEYNLKLGTYFLSFIFLGIHFFIKVKSTYHKMNVNHFEVYDSAFRTFAVLGNHDLYLV